MAIENTKDANLTNMDSSPPKRVSLHENMARVKTICATVEVAAADDDGSVYRIGRVHSSNRIKSIKVANDAITGGTAFDIGLYAKDDGAAVDDDAYASAVDLSSALGMTEYAYEARDIANIKNRVWQDAAQSEDPDVEYDICLTGDTVGTAAGTISAEIEVVVGD